MIATITKIGNSPGIVFDKASVERMRLKAGDMVNLELHDGGVITLTPLYRKAAQKKVSAAIKATIKNHARTMKELA